jgi:hypothetical protein
MTRDLRLHSVCAALVVTVLNVPAVAHAQDPQAKGAQLLAEARKAIGGEEKLRAVKTLQANGSFRRTAGNITVDGDVEMQIETPHKYRRNESIGFAGGPTIDRTEVLNGTDAWEETSRAGSAGLGAERGGSGSRGGFGGGREPGAGAPGASEVDPERLREAQRRVRQADFSRLMLGWLLTTDAPVTWVGTAESPDGTADVLEIKPQGGEATRLFVNSTTHIPLMMTWQGQGPRQFQLRGGRRGRGDAPQGQTNQPDQELPRAQRVQPSATLAMHLSGYKAVNGIKLPFMITRSVNDQIVEEITITSYKINPSFKANTFTRPGV